MTSRTLLIGLDAACWEYLDPLLATGRLPTIRRLMDSGAWGVLRSTLPASTPVAWSSIVTGKNPGKHGVFDMLWRKPGSYQFNPTSLAVRQGTPFWALLNAHGLRVGLVNVPFSYPLPAVDGFALAGFGAPDTAADLAHPPGLMAWITEHVGHYVAPSRLYELRKQMTIPEIVQLEHEHQRMLVEITAALVSKDPVDVLVINLMLLDHINHLDQDLSVVGEALDQLDRDLAVVIEAFQPGHILAISDHGSRQIEGVFYLHNWLLANGYTARVRRDPADRRQAINTLLAEWFRLRRGPRGVVEKLLRRVLLELLNRAPTTLADPVWRAAAKRFPNAKDFVDLTGKTDYGRSLTVRASTYSGNLYLNLQGRDPQGIVSPERRSAVLEELSGRLLALRDPTGRPLFEGAHFSEDLYSGPGVPYAPDLVLDGYRSAWNASLRYPGLQDGGEYFLKHTRHEGWHSRDGIFIYCGPAFQAGRSGTLRHVMDIPATLLALHGIPIPEDYDGQAMAETMNIEWLERHPLDSQPGDPPERYVYDLAIGQEDNDVLMAQLRALGYVD